MRTIIIAKLLCSIPLTSFARKGDRLVKYNYDHFRSTGNIPEPSDVAYDKETNHLFIVSDHGMLFETDLTGKVIRKAKEGGLDFEGVIIKNGYVYVSDETPGKIYKYRKDDLELMQTYKVSWSGALNRAFESITYNETKNCFVLVSQAPPVIIEYDTSFKELNRYPFNATRDVSSARWHNNSCYILGNKDRTIFECDPLNYRIKQAYLINVLNPEGLDFDSDENVYITSDDLQRLYFFKPMSRTDNKL
jgi:uncharacterized protein YjiK